MKAPPIPPIIGIPPFVKGVVPPDGNGSVMTLSSSYPWANTHLAPS